MSGYVIANIDVKNPEAYKEYVGKVVPTVQKFGGEYLVRAGEYKVIDGCLLYTSPSPRDEYRSRMPSAA